MPQDAFERHIQEMPEPKLELLDGRFVVGNGAGNLQLLRHVLDGWGAEAAVPMAAEELWREALHRGFQNVEPPAPGKPLAVWRAWATQLTYAPQLAPAGPMLDRNHREARERVTMSLYGLARERKFAHIAGRDIVMRLGEEAFTPDVFAVGPGQASRVNEHYLNGPADLVIEVVLRGHEGYDRELKRRRYAAAGVAEYWLIDPDRRSFEFLRMGGDGYRPVSLEPDGSYHSTAFPGLTFRPDLLWEGESWVSGPNPFSVEADLPLVPRGFAKGGMGWGELVFDPQPGLEPRRLSFDEFISWAPEAKFEVIDGKPWVGGSRGSRNVIGLLLRTEGMVKAVSVLHPRAWVEALILAEEDRTTDADRRVHWWEIARQVADELRGRFGFARLVVIGDLVQPQPLNRWSDITLVAFDLPKKHDTWHASDFLYKTFRGELDIDLIRYEHLTRSQKDAADTVGVEV